MRVGDRIQITDGGNVYVGDVVYISWFHLVLFEDVTLDTCLKNNGRAGRIIFLPMFLKFTSVVVNYSRLDYLGIKTVWDGVSFLIDFGSDLQVARNKAREIVDEYSREFRRKMYQQLHEKRKYFMYERWSMRKIANRRPRVFAMLEGKGMRLYVFYITEPHRTLEARHEISVAIMKEFKALGISMATTSDHD